MQDGEKLQIQNKVLKTRTNLMNAQQGKANEMCGRNVLKTSGKQ